ncbi:MAG: endonuclease/exonuclease/phosphatase family protein [Phycisphaeraceae bacterium]|nr:endonuclease/exonuclease/phosphatase family protein [Phycisphaeraceae bacterium]
MAFHHDEHQQRVDLDAEPVVPRGRARSRVLLVIAGGLPTVATLLGFLGLVWWPLDVLANFRFQYAVILLVTAVVSLATLRWKLALLFCLPLALNVAVILPVYLPTTDVQAYRQYGLMSRMVPSATRWDAPDEEAEKPSTQPATTQPAAVEKSPGNSVARRHHRQPTALPVSTQPAGAEDDPQQQSGWWTSDNRQILRLANVYADVPERNMDNLLDYLRELDADVVVLQGVTEDLRHRLEFQIAPFKMEHVAARSDGFGMALLVRITMRPKVRILGAKMIELSHDEMRLPAIVARVRWGRETVSLLAVHAAPPLSSRAEAIRQSQYQAIALWVSNQEYAPVVLGNLSAAPWAASFQTLLAKTALVNSQLGYGMETTWPAGGGFPLGEIPIDHCLHDSDLVTVSRTLGPTLGSDHRALVVHLAWTSDIKRPLIDGFNPKRK